MSEKQRVRVTVRSGVDAFTSRSKHTIPHAQSSPRVNLSIGARSKAGTGRDRRGGAKDRKQEERDIKGRETPVRAVVVRKTRFIWKNLIISERNPASAGRSCCFCHFLATETGKKLE